MGRTAIIIGAGPAGLTAAYELVTRTDIQPIVFERTGDIGGISKTVEYHGNRMDIGGHRFFSKSDRVVDWWLNILPLQTAPSRDDLLLNRSVAYDIRVEGAASVVDPEHTNKVMLVRSRLSRIYFLRKFFSYPVTLSSQTIANLGIIQIVRIGMSYIKARLFPIRKEKSLEDFFINRFGRELYLTFFKDYTEKVWGRPCNDIDPSWGAQRIKGLSITKAIIHAAKKAFTRDASVRQKGIETSLIERFMYPKFGPGQMWEEVAKIIESKGGAVHRHHSATGMILKKNRISSVRIHNHLTGEDKTVCGDYFFSTMPVKDLIGGMDSAVPNEIRHVAAGLEYRDFITVGLILKKLKIRNETKIATTYNIIPDNWIYIQERDVKLGRLQIFNNWSPYLVADPHTVSLGLEYFCNEGDSLWDMSDDAFRKMAITELTKIGIIDAEDVLDGTVVRMPKTYPAYFGTYEHFDIVRKFTDDIENLFLIGRNGMHRYNNQDHSMLTAITAVDNIIAGVTAKDNIWQVNTEEEYHEERR